MIKNFYVDPHIGYSQVSDSYGGQDIRITPTPELMSLMMWWKEWRAVFESKDPSVVDALNQARVLHAITQG